VKRLCAVLVLVACSGPSRGEEETSTDATLPDAAPEQVRPVTDVFVAPAGAVYWSYGLEVCSLEFGCWYGGPTVSMREASTPATWVIDDSGAGAMQLAGDDKGVFIVTGVTHEERYVKELGGPALSIPRPRTRGPAIDGTYVYWAERESIVAGVYMLRRATRTGDGSDVVTIASLPDVDKITLYTGYIWGFQSDGDLFRVPSAGGPVEIVMPHVFLMNVTTIGLVIGRSWWMNNQAFAELGVIDASGAYTALHPLDPAGAVRYVVADERDLVWTSGSEPDITVFRKSLTTDAIDVIASQVRHGNAIALTPDRILYDFTPEGFKTFTR